MISFCVTLLKTHYQRYFPILLESIVNYCPLVDEIIVCKNEEEKSYEEKFNYSGKYVKIYGCEYNKPIYGYNIQSIDHALSMHQCIDKTKNDYIFLCDPDIFFYNEIDVFYINLIKKYKLNVVGTPYINANNPLNKLPSIQGNFPALMNCLVKKSDLPPKNWLNKFLKIANMEYTGKYLIPIINLPKEILQKFPNPEGHIDTSFLLCLWAMESKWNWLSFLPEDGHNYCSKYYRGNVKIKEKPMKLFYHQRVSSHGDKIIFSETIFADAYNKFKKSTEENA